MPEKRKKGGETMPIKWSALEVSEAMDEVEHQLSLAEAFLDEARAKALRAENIGQLPLYMEQRVRRVVYEIDRMDNIRNAIKSVRAAIPDGAVEADQERRNQSLQI